MARGDDMVGLETLRSLHARFLSAIRDGRWEDAQGLQEQRFALMDILLGEARYTPAIAGELSAIVAKDRELLPQIEAARARVAEELKSLHTNRKAASAYGAAG